VAQGRLSGARDEFYDRERAAPGAGVGEAQVGLRAVLGRRGSRRRRPAGRSDPRVALSCYSPLVLTVPSGPVCLWRWQLLQQQVAAVTKCDGPQTKQSSPMIRHLNVDFFAGHSFNRKGPTSTPVDSCFNREGPAWDFKVENSIASDGANSRPIDKDFVRSEPVCVSGAPNHSDHAGSTRRHRYFSLNQRTDRTNPTVSESGPSVKSRGYPTHHRVGAEGLGRRYFGFDRPYRSASGQPFALAAKPLGLTIRRRCSGACNAAKSGSGQMRRTHYE